MKFLHQVLKLTKKYHPENWT